jgi:toxin YoeB
MATRTAWSEAAWQDVLTFRQADERIFKTIFDLIRDIKARPSKGHGSPQPLQHALHGWSSRRIAGAHRLVYRIVVHHGSDQRLEIVQCRYHY